MQRSLLSLGIMPGLLTAAPLVHNINLHSSESLLPLTASARLSQAPITNPTIPVSAADFVQRGMTRADEGDRAGAIADFTQAIKLKPDDANAWYCRAVTHLLIGDRKNAIVDFTQVIALQPPNQADAYNERGNARGALGDHQGAIADFTQAIKLKPGHALAYGNRGASRLNLNDYQGAIANFTQAIKLKPDEAEIYTLRGSAYLRLRDKQRAIADFTQAIKLKPDDTLAHNLLNLAQSTSGHLGARLGEVGLPDQALQGAPQAITIAANGTLCIKGQRTSLTDLLPQLQQIVTTPIILTAHLETPYKTVLAVTDRLRASGFHSIKLKTSSESLCSA